jgi:hypothetical protein
MTKQMNFEPVTQQDGISVGKLEGETWSGVYLSSEFLNRLAGVLAAAQIRIATLDKTVQIPDAVRNLLGITTGLLATYATAVQPERDTHHDAQMKEAWEGLMQLQAMLDDIKR